jgi:hypothetical protein
MKKNLVLFFGFMVILITGCATGQWMKEGSTKRDYSRDFAKCQGLTANVKWIDLRTNAFNHCMYGEGWDWVIEGKKYNPTK